MTSCYVAPLLLRPSAPPPLCSSAPLPLCPSAPLHSNYWLRRLRLRSTGGSSIPDLSIVIETSAGDWQPRASVTMILIS